MNPFSHPRRRFIRSTCGIVLAAAFSPRVFGESAQIPGKKLFTAVGISGSLDQAAILKEAGAEFLTESVGSFLVPDQPDAVFEKNLAKLATSPLPILACNSFIRPSNLHCIGPDANHGPILDWSDTAFRRLKQTGGQFIVFGSGGARKLPDGWPQEKADAQFVTLLKAMGNLAEKHAIIVVVEQLRAEECNFINRIERAATLIRSAGHPHVRVLADLYHMRRMGDTPADLKAAMDVVVHVEVAEKETRSYPGISGDDFRPFFQILRESRYTGAISIEGKGEPNQVAPAFAEIARQAAEV
jgi:sugar phosphate isomerase/epimerase